MTILVYYFESLSWLSRIALLYAEAIFGLYFFSLLGEGKGHMFEWQRLTIPFLIICGGTFIISIIGHFSEEICFGFAFFKISAIGYSVGCLALIVNLITERNHGK